MINFIPINTSVSSKNVQILKKKNPLGCLRNFSRKTAVVDIWWMQNLHFSNLRFGVYFFPCCMVAVSMYGIAEKLRPIFWRETRKECENLDWLQVRVAQNMGRYFISQMLITKLSWFTRINLIRISRIAVNHGSLRSTSQTKLVHVIPSDPIDSPNWIQFGHSFTNVHRNYSM